MKKVLFATTALIASASFAYADITVGGDAHLGVIYDGTNSTTTVGGVTTTVKPTTTVKHRMRLKFTVTKETQNGITFMAKSRVTLNNGDDGSVNKDGNLSVTDANGTLGHNSVSMKAGGLTLEVGATSGAMKTLARTDVSHGFDAGGLYSTAGGSGIDNNVALLGADGNNLLIRYDIGDFSVAAAMEVAGTNRELAAKYTFNSFTIGAGVDNNDNWMLATSYNGGNWNVGLGTNHNSDVVMTAGYDISDATNIGFGVEGAGKGASKGKINAVGLQVEHDLGGANLVGAVGQINGSTSVASLGINFNF